MQVETDSLKVGSVNLVFCWFLADTLTSHRLLSVTKSVNDVRNNVMNAIFYGNFDFYLY